MKKDLGSARVRLVAMIDGQSEWIFARDRSAN
jgi:hypothetical protein